MVIAVISICTEDLRRAQKDIGTILLRALLWFLCARLSFCLRKNFATLENRALDPTVDLIHVR